MIAAFSNILHHIFSGVHLAGQKGCHQLNREVSFQISRLKGNHGIGRTVRLVEPVAGEGLDVVEDLLRPLQVAVLGLGRAAQGRPWIFAEIKAAIRGEEWTPPTVGDVIDRNLLTTRIRTPKNVRVTIPNTNILSGQIINFTIEINNTNIR